MSGVSRNLNGQRIGRKGRVTRERIIAAAQELLDGSPRDAPISLSAVARQASLGLSSLYNYFSDLSELLVAVLEPVMASAEDGYLGLIRLRWSDEELEARCYEFIRAYHHFWVKHARILHLRNQMSDQLDKRMTRSRIAATQPIIGLLVVQMGGDPADSRSPEYAMATVLMIGIERSIRMTTDDGLPMQLYQNILHNDDHFLRPCARLMEMAIRDCRLRNGSHQTASL